MAEDRYLVDKRLPIARHELRIVKFTSANLDLAIPHTLRPIKPNDVKWEIVDTNSPGILYRGSKAAQKEYIVLRSTALGTFQLRLYIPAYYDEDDVPETVTNPFASILESVYPVGTVYTNGSNCTNPGTLLGIGTWVAHSAGRVIVGIDATQVEFDTLAETGGAKIHTLTVAEMPSHTHIQDAHTHNILNNVDEGASTGVEDLTQLGGVSTAGIVVSATATNQNTGSGGAHNNLQPYIVNCVWMRTS